MSMPFFDTPESTGAPEQDALADLIATSTLQQMGVLGAMADAIAAQASAYQAICKVQTQRHERISNWFGIIVAGQWALIICMAAALARLY